MPLLQVLSQSQDVSSAQLTGRGGTCVGQHRRLPAAQVCVKPDLCIDWILQAVIKRNTSQDQRLNEYLDISSIYTFIHIHIYIYTLFISDVSGLFSATGFQQCYHPASCKKNAGVPWWAVTSAGNSDRSRRYGSCWRNLRDDRQLKARTSCISAPAAASGMWFFCWKIWILYTFEKTTRTVDVMREYELYDYIKTLLMFYVSHIARWLPCIDWRGYQGGRVRSIDDMRMSMGPWRIGLDRWSKRLRKACGTMDRPPLEMYASVCYWFLCAILCYYDLLFWKVICICCRHYILRHTIDIHRHIRYLSICNKRLAPGEFGNLKMSWLRIY